jgi:hypothetical protein
MKIRLRIVLFALSITVGQVAYVRAQPAEMTFFAQPPIPPKEIFGNAWRIFAEGPIDPEAPARFKRTIVGQKIPPLSVGLFQFSRRKFAREHGIGTPNPKEWIFHGSP